MKRDSVLSLVGIAKKADKVVSGEFQTETAVKSGKARLVIISTEASGNTKKSFRICALIIRFRRISMEPVKSWEPRPAVNTELFCLCWMMAWQVRLLKR